MDSGSPLLLLDACESALLLIARDITPEPCVRSSRVCNRGACIWSHETHEGGRCNVCSHIGRSGGNGTALGLSFLARRSSPWSLLQPDGCCCCGGQIRSRGRRWRSPGTIPEWCLGCLVRGT